jgi:hypothetical protein
VHLVWQGAYPPAICVRILEIRRVKQSVLGFLCTYVCIVWIRRLVYRFDFSQQLPYIFRLVYDTNIKLALLGSARRGLGSLGFILNIMASVEHSYLAPGLYIWRLWFIPHVCPTISTALKVFGPQKILVYVIGISEILI